MMDTSAQIQNTLRTKRIAFIGCGVMAEAITSILLRAELVGAEQITGSEPIESRRREFAAKYGVHVVADNCQAIDGADLVMLTIKPQTLDTVMRELAGSLADRQVVVSIVPGATIERLSTGLRHDTVVRSMPNTPSQIGHGATVWFPSVAVDDMQQAMVGAVLSAMGVAVRVDTEEAVDMATALSGTGPAYVFLLMEALIDAGVHLGFSRKVAEQLVHQTVLGSVLFAQESGKHPAELRNMVTTPGGTTASAMFELEQGGLRTVIARGVWAAYKRAQELGQGRRNGGPGVLS